MTEDYDAVIFDCDGVLVAPTDREVLVSAVVDTFAAFDVAVSRAVAEQTVVDGTVPVDLAREHDLHPEGLWHHRELTASLAQQAHTRMGGKPVYDDVAAISELTCPVGLVSNNQHATIEFLLAYHDLPAFETARGRQPTLAGAAKRKPAPDYIEQAMTELGCASALYVGDSPKDIRAAQAAGIDSAFLRRDHVAELDLTPTPTFEVATLRELCDHVSPQLV